MLADGTIWFGDEGRGMLGRLDPATGQVKEWPAPGGAQSRPYAVTKDEPARFVPGTRYTLTISLTRAGMKRSGFQLTARFTDHGTQAGSLASPPAAIPRAGRWRGPRPRLVGP